MAKIQAGEQKELVQVSYALKPGFAVNSTAYVQVKACYSPYSQYDRPWRKANPVIAVSCESGSPKALQYPLP